MNRLTQRFILRDKVDGDGSGEVAPVAVAPVAAPVTAPTVTPEVTPVTPTVTFKSSAAQQLADMVSQAGMQPTDVLKAVQANGGKATPEIYAALETKHGAGMAALLAGQMNSLHEETVSKSKAADQAIFAQVAEGFKGITEQSGEETFNELATWAKANFDEAKVTEVNKLIKQGGMAAQLAIQELTNAFKQSGDFTQPAQLLEGDNTTSTNTAGGDLTRMEYRKELQTLLDKGHEHSTSREIAALGRRRTKSMARGIR